MIIVDSFNVLVTIRDTLIKCGATVKVIGKSENTFLGTKALGTNPPDNKFIIKAAIISTMDTYYFEKVYDLVKDADAIIQVKGVACEKFYMEYADLYLKDNLLHINEIR